jgi:glycosyltransferase involved in cell wall biosynthesis
MDKVICNVSSYNRPETLIKTIDSIYNQCDVINVALNSYDEIPIELYDKKINLLITDNEKGDAYKFTNLNISDGYFLTIDDDLIYPENYTEYIIDKIEEYNRESIITFHGRSFDEFPIDSYYNIKTNVSHFKRRLNEDTKVQFGGTGVMGFHTDLFKIGLEYFKFPNMADIWIGKYAKEHSIDIICSKRKRDFIQQQYIKESIYNSSNKSDKIQTEIVNSVFEDKDISIIVPTFNNVEFIEECINSIVKSCRGFKYEILVGIDKCEPTLTHVKNGEYNQNTKFYYFNENVGPYVIKNTLSVISKSESLIFFDSDDIMGLNMVNEVIGKLNHYGCVKPKYNEFGENKLHRNNSNNNWGEGVFGIKKPIFLHYNGFEPWRCAADSDFMGRLIRNKVKMYVSPEILFERRIHSKNLTLSKDTGFMSEIRGKYQKLSKGKTDFGPLPSLVTSLFSVIDTKMRLHKEVYDSDELESPTKKVKNVDSLPKDFNLKRKSTPDKLEGKKNKGVNPIPKVSKPKKEKPKLPIKDFNPKKESVPVNYDQINQSLKNKSIYIPKKDNPSKQNKPKDRKELIEIKRGSMAELAKKMGFGDNKKRKR